MSGIVFRFKAPYPGLDRARRERFGGATLIVRKPLAECRGPALAGGYWAIELVPVPQGAGGNQISTTFRISWLTIRTAPGRVETGCSSPSVSPAGIGGTGIGTERATRTGRDKPHPE